MYRVHVIATPRSSSTFVRALVFAGAVAAMAPAVAQREFRVYPSFEGDVAEAPLPPDYQVPGELVIGHLMFPDSRFGSGGQWRYGVWGLLFLLPSLGSFFKAWLTAREIARGASSGSSQP